MKAAVYRDYGGPDALTIEEIEKPAPSEGEVLIRVRAASINDWDLGLLRGAPFVNRLLNGLQRPKLRVLGCDVAGVVEAVGEKVDAFQPGDEVFGDLCASGFGAFAEFVCAPEAAIAHIPQGIEFEQAAAIPQAGMLAVQGLIDLGRLQAGQKVLLNGAGGGVGTFALQVAKLLGAEVTVVDSAAKLDMLRLLGADHVIDYAEQDFTRCGERYDLILDVRTNRPPSAYARALNPGGAYVTVGGDLSRVFHLMLAGPMLSAASRRHFRVVRLKPNKDLRALADLVQSGDVIAVIEGPYQLPEIADAFRLFEAGAHKGKIIVRPD